MIQFKVFRFNPFQENCIVAYTKNECIIFDPGCYDEHECAELSNFILGRRLKVKMLINTHCHLDHIFGNKFVYDTFALKPLLHQKELFFLSTLDKTAASYGLAASPSPDPLEYLDEGSKIELDDRQIQILLTPGHSPGSLCFYFENENTLIGGDVLFRESIGRTDLPFGSFEHLEYSIQTKLYKLPDETKVIPGHGPATTIGYEKRNNPFVKAIDPKTMS